MPSKRILLIGGVQLLPGRLRNAGPSMAGVCDELEPQLRNHGYIANAPFETVSLIFRFGSQDRFDPVIGAIDKRHHELPVAITFDLKRLVPLHRQELQSEFRRATIEVLCDVAANFDLPFEFLDVMRV